MMTDDQILEVVQAHKEGRQIQVLEIHSGLGWQDVFENKPNWNFGCTNYRVKPEPRKPREWLVHVDGGDHITQAGNQNVQCDRCIRVREVIEE